MPSDKDPKAMARGLGKIFRKKKATQYTCARMAVTFYRCTSYLDPSVIEGILAGEAAEWQSPEMLLLVALFWLIPFTMAFLSVTLRDSANRWANIILGIVFTCFNIYHLTIHLAEPTAHQLLIVLSTVVVTALIVWCAWKRPKPEV